MSLFHQISKLLSGENDRLSVDVIGMAKGEIKVRISPDLGPTPSNASDEEVEIRALMASPLTVTGRPEEVDQLLEEHLSKRVQVQQIGADALNTLSAKMVTAAKKASSATPKADTKSNADSSAEPPSGTETAAPAEPTKAPSIEDSF